MICLRGLSSIIRPVDEAALEVSGARVQDGIVG